MHNSTFDLAFHGWREPLERVAALAQEKGIALATLEIGLGKSRENRKWMIDTVGDPAKVNATRVQVQCRFAFDFCRRAPAPFTDDGESSPVCLTFS